MRQAVRKTLVTPLNSELPTLHLPPVTCALDVPALDVPRTTKKKSRKFIELESSGQITHFHEQVGIWGVVAG